VAFPNPWPGGWWHIRDIIDYQLIAAKALIGLSARQRRILIRNYVELGRRAVEAGGSQPPHAYVIPAEQRDPGSAAAMLEVLRRGGVEIHRAEAPFTADGFSYAAGDWVVLMAQPYRSHAKDLLERQDYPDLRLYPGGPPDTPYDVSGWTLPLQMGVEAVEVSSPFDAELALESDAIQAPAGSVDGSGPNVALANTANAANLAIHRTIAAGGTATFLADSLATGGRSLPPGGVVLSGSGVNEIVTELASTEGLSGHFISGNVEGYRVDALRVGLYQPWTASMDEGWTRWVFDTWDMPYRTVRDAEIRRGELRDRYDVIVLPDLSPTSITEGRKPGTVPAQYAGGLGDEGVRAIRAFVRAGGTLICLASSSGFAIEALDLQVEDARPSFSEQRSGDHFYAPGSILAVTMDPTHPIGFGMREESAVYYSNGPIFEVDSESSDVIVVARYPESGQLLSGYALNADFLAGKAAIVEARYGEGRAILFGFRPQHRGQPHETFKILFNAVYRGAANAAEPATF
jgi:hypothetical protein